jgi:F420-dependent oxidoreductase-like protein
MKLGLQVPNFTWAGGPERLGVTLGDIVAAAEEAGFESIWVMDHFFQIQFVGPPEMEMLESYTTLGYIAARTSRVGLGTMVTGVTYRHPGILAKQVTTLDVLSGGRAMLGIGAAWYEQEHRGLGVPYPPLKERFERLEETIQVCLAMWRDGDAPYEGKHYRLERTLNSPQVLSKPHPPILIGGSGERKTLKLVARYADACNLFPDPRTLGHKLEVLRRHCEDEGRDYATIEKTSMANFDASSSEAAKRTVGFLRMLAGHDIQTAIGSVRGVDDLANLRRMGKEVIPAAAELEPASPAPA